MAFFGEAAEDIDVAIHAASAGATKAQRKLLNVPTGTTGCAPESKPLLLAGGVE
jgi:hypothetical protein